MFSSEEKKKGGNCTLFYKSFWLFDHTKNEFRHVGMYLPPSHVLYMHFSLIFLFRCGDNGPFPAPKSISSYAFAFVYFPFSVGNCWWGLD